VSSLIAGFIAGKIVNKSLSAILLDIILGIVGAIVGGFLFSLIGVGGITGFNVWSMLVGIVGGGCSVGALSRDLRPKPCWAIERQPTCPRKAELLAPLCDVRIVSAIHELQRERGSGGTVN
jgi:uncharacterized membrane protein YeaQ/YmgE (transglycosylase-associated protein family)